MKHSILRNFLFFFSFFFIISISKTSAQVIITGISPVNNMCAGNGVSTLLSPIILSESLYTDIRNAGGGYTASGTNLTLYINIPNGFSFVKNVGNVSYQLGRDITSASLSVTGSSAILNIVYSANNQLDIITISGIKVFANDGEVNSSITTTGNLLLNGASSTWHNLSSVAPGGGVFGLSSKYCYNSNNDTLSFFPSNGSFSVLPSISGVLFSAGLPANKKGFNPRVYKNTVVGTNLKLVYNYPDINGSGCTYFERDINIGILPAPMIFSLPTVTGAQGGSTTVLDLGARPSVGGVGLFSGPGVSGYKFYVNLVTTTGSPFGKKTLLYTFTSSVTGCSDTVSKAITLWDPSLTFEFSPLPTLGGANFCADDNNNYSVYLNTLAGIPTPEVAYNNCCCDRSIKISGPGVSGTNYNMSSFVFRPSLVGVTSITGSYNLSYDADYGGSGSATSTTCSAIRIPYIWRNQVVKIFPKPEPPTGITTTDGYCFGAVSNDIITVTSNLNNPLYKWYYYPTTVTKVLKYSSTISGVDVSTLGLTNSSLPGIYKYSVTQVVNGCEGLEMYFNIEIKPIPNKPIKQNTASSLLFCQKTNITPILEVNTVLGSLTWSDPINFQTVIGTNTYSVTGFDKFGNNTVGSFNYYVSVTENGCTSPSETITVVVNSIPGIPSLVSSNVYCERGTLLPISVGVGVGNVSPSNAISQSGFRWYSDSECLNPINADSTGSSLLVGPNIQNRFNLSLVLSNLSALDTSFYVKTRSQFSGCKSELPLKVPVKIKLKPEVPGVMNVSNNYFGGQPLCINAYNNITLTGVSSFQDAQFTWYQTSNLTGPSITSIGFVTSITGSTSISKNFFVKQSLNGCFSDSLRVTVDILPAISKPLVTIPGFACTGDNLPDLFAEATTVDGIINWYSDMSLTNKIATDYSINARTFISSNTLPGNYLVYLTQQVGNCESSPMFEVLTVTIRQTPIQPTVSMQAYCQGSSILPISATGTAALNPSFRWYKDISKTELVGNGSTTIVGPLSVNKLNDPTTLTGFTNDFATYYYASQIVNGCESDLSLCTIVGFKLPLRFNVSSPRPVCSGSPVPILSKIGSGIRWYSDITLNTLVGSNAALNTTNITVPGAMVSTFVGYYDTSVPGVPRKYIYYSTRTSNIFSVPGYSFAGCQSLPIGDTITIFPLPPLPNAASPLPYCSGDDIRPLTAIGVNVNPSPVIRWYNESNVFIKTGDSLSIEKNTIYSNQVNYIFKVSQVVNTCESPLGVLTITGNPLPSVNIIGFNKPSYCSYDQIFTIAGVPLGGTFTGASAGLVNSGGGYGTFSPTLAGANLNNYLIKYNFTDANGCKNSETKTIKVNISPKVSFVIGTIDSTKYCNLPGSIELKPNDANNAGSGIGTFSISTGNGISGTSFYPSLSGNGIFDIKYKFFINSTGCLDSTIRTVTIYPQPSADFSTSSLCQGDSITLTDISTISGGGVINQWNWRIIPGKSYSIQNPTAYFGETGNYKIEFTASTPNGCSSKRERNINIGPYPIPSFKWKSICYGTDTRFIDSTKLLIGEIENWRWDFGDLSVASDTSNLQNPFFRFSTIGKYSVKLSITSDKNCVSDTVIDVNIIPSIGTFPYVEDFNATNGGWFSEGKNNDWGWGNPSGKTYLTNPGNIWVTGIDSLYKKNQQSWVNSPCYDFSMLKQPMFAFDKKNLTEQGIDGAVLQYSLDGGDSWKNIGEKYTGLNWFTNSNIFANPGSQRNYLNGWSGLQTVAGFERSSHVLDSTLIGKANVRFRVAFASTDKGQSFDGFGFDNVWIGERQKRTVIEHFTNNADQNSSDVLYPANRFGIGDLVNANQLNVYGIFYHTSFPSRDTFNIINPADVSSRVLYYSIKNTPTTVFEGNYYKGIPLPLSTDSLLPQIGLNQLKVDLRTLETPKFKLEISKNIIGNTLSASAKITPLQSISDSNLILQIAIVERKLTNYTSPLGESLFENVFKAFLPNASGNDLKNNWSVGNTIAISKDWAINNIFDPSQIAVIAFLQNNDTKEILQTAYDGPSVVYIPRNQINGNDDFLISAIPVIYPNPVIDKLYIKFNSDQANFKFNLINNLGNAVKIGRINSKSYEINVDDLPAGVYQLVVSDDLNIRYSKRIVIIH